MDNWQKYAAEFLGTFVLVFGGSVAILASVGTGSPTLIVAAFAFGLSLLAGLYAFGEISGGHFNPAVSLAMYLSRSLTSNDLVSYWIAQFLGGIAAAILLLIATSQDEVAATTTIPGDAGSGTAFLMEVTFTAIFVLVILSASVSERFGGSALLAIALTLVTVHLAAIPFSGSSVNPARTFGPDLVGGEWDGIWIYLIAPPLGAAIAAAVRIFVVAGPTPPAPSAVAEVLTDVDVDEPGRPRT